ncbi:hypothetical protein Mapa_014298 [Marchantia paleacea]|nr:hypothetical protein Mapa_014298 [Marchantia paleacea]
MTRPEQTSSEAAAPTEAHSLAIASDLPSSPARLSLLCHHCSLLVSTECYASLHSHVHPSSSCEIFITRAPRLLLLLIRQQPHYTTLQNTPYIYTL